MLTNILTKVWSGYDVKEYKKLKDLQKENLRDNMTNMEMVLNMLAETSSTEIAKKTNPKGISATKTTVIKGATIAKEAREKLELETGEKIVTDISAKKIRNLKESNN